MPDKLELPWWKRAVIYQIYPRSFQDSNGDGIGDLAGITSRLEYCRWLGVSAVWLSPIYPSPMADFGYDISDYTDIHPRFGSLRDFDALMAEAQRLELKVLLDFVPNHTSDAHPWFVESCSSRDNPYRDWYIWRDPGPDGGPPNNWLSTFGGSAWEWDAATGQYYYHAYLKEQPDLNWRNPEVQQTMLEVLRFWLGRGVAGFRIDALSHLIKDKEFRDDPPNPNYRPDQAPYFQLLPIFSADQPEVHDVIAMMRGVIDQYNDRVMIGEMYLPIDRLMAYYGTTDSGLHFPFNFELIQTPWDSLQIGVAIAAYEKRLSAQNWPNWVLGNHDKHRVASRIGRAQARVAAMLLLTLRGTPTLYYGDEIGMQDVPIPADRVHDPWEKNVPGLGLGRDPERTPMQWAAERNAGFSSAEPWLPVADDYQTVNVDVQRHDPRSMLSLVRQLLDIRAREPVLSHGDYISLRTTSDVLTYLRQWNGKRYLVALNFTAHPAQIDLRPRIAGGKVRLSTAKVYDEEEVNGTLSLGADEGLLIELD